MKCKICGAELKKEGDICNKCYEKLKIEEDLEQDKKVLYKIKRKYVPGYEIVRLGDYLLLGILVCLSLLATKKILEFLIFTVAFVGIIGIIVFNKKKKSKNTSCTFYEKKIVYRSNEKEKVIKYTDVKDIGYYQTFTQKLFHIGDLRIYPNASVFVASAIDIINIKNVEEEYKKVKKIIQEQAIANEEEN